MFHHLRGHSRTWTFWPAAPRRRMPRTAYGPRLDRLEDRIAMSGVTVSYSTSSAWLLVVGDGADNQIEVGAAQERRPGPDCHDCHSDERQQLF